MMPPSLKGPLWKLWDFRSICGTYHSADSDGGTLGWGPGIIELQFPITDRTTVLYTHTCVCIYVVVYHSHRIVPV